MLRAIPALRAFAVTLVGNTDSADDLVQETLLRAIACIGSFVPGTNMTAWLITILRNTFFTQYRKNRIAKQYLASLPPTSSKAHAEQHGSVELQELRKALMALPTEQREALILVGASGYSYDQAAAICGCVPGTLKSRVSRARARLAVLLQIEQADEIGPERHELAIVA